MIIPILCYHSQPLAIPPPVLSYQPAALSADEETLDAILAAFILLCSYKNLQFYRKMCAWQRLE